MSILNHFFDYKPEVLALDEKAMELCQPYFRHMEEIRDFNQLKMLKAFADTQMSSTDMLGTTGYGLWDTGRAKLEQIFAEVMGAEEHRVLPFCCKGVGHLHDEPPADAFAAQGLCSLAAGHVGLSVCDRIGAHGAHRLPALLQRPDHGPAPAALGAQF